MQNYYPAIYKAAHNYYKFPFQDLQKLKDMLNPEKNEKQQIRLYRLKKNRNWKWF